MTIHPVTDHLMDYTPEHADRGMGTQRPMRIWAWQADQGGCGFYRVADPLRAMVRYGGHKVQITPQVQGFVEHRMLGHGELCLIQRVVFLDMLPAVRRLATPDRKLVYEIDDNMFAIDPRNRNAFQLYAQPAVIDGLRTAASVCDLITVTTPDLAAEMERQCGIPTVVLPNLVDDEMFTIDRPHNDRVTVGWAGGQGHESDMRTVAGQIRRFLARHPAVDFHVIGYDYRRMLGQDRVYLSTWQDPITAYWRSLDFDIGIAPLAHNIFNRGKSGLKALEYGALGIPTVATDAAPYRDVIIDGVTGFLVTQDWQWERRLHELANDEAMRTEMGAAAKAHVLANHSLSRHWRRWEATYARLLGLDHRAPELAPRPVSTGSTPYLLRTDRRVLIG